MLYALELSDALGAPEVRDEEPIPFVRELLHDVLDGRICRRDDANGLSLGDQRGDQVEDRLRFSGAWRPVDDRDLVSERGAYGVALIEVGVEGHHDSVARAGVDVRPADEEGFEGGAWRHGCDVFPHVG